MRGKIARRLARVMNCDTWTIESGEPIISLSFDDVPRSACTTGAKILAKYGATATWYVSGIFECDDASDRFHDQRCLQDLNAAGHEIACHGYAHLNYQATSATSIKEDLDRNLEYFDRSGLPAPRNFAYPYGCVSPSIKLICAKRFRSCRGIQTGINRTRVDLNLVRSVPFYSQSLSWAKTRALVDDVASNGGWLTFFTHAVTDRPSEFDCTPAHLEQMIAHVSALKIPLVSMNQALDTLFKSR